MQAVFRGLVIVEKVRDRKIGGLLSALGILCFFSGHQALLSGLVPVVVGVIFTGEDWFGDNGDCGDGNLMTVRTDMSSHLFLQPILTIGIV